MFFFIFNAGRAEKHELEAWSWKFCIGVQFLCELARADLEASHLHWNQIALQNVHLYNNSGKE